MKRFHIFPVIALLLAVMLSACATVQNNHDPIEPANRVRDNINDNIDRMTLKHLARGYTAAIPEPMRTAVSNFYDNASYVNTILNDFLTSTATDPLFWASLALAPCITIPITAINILISAPA